MRQKITESELGAGAEVLSTKPSFETWAPSAPYSCKLDSECLPNPGDYHEQMEHAGNAADLLYSDMISRGVTKENAEWVYSQMISRFNARIQDNNESIMGRDIKNDNHKYVQELLYLANNGKADVHRLMSIREFLDLSSIELGRVSAPSLNAREIYVTDMLSSVQKEIEHRSGVFEPTPSEFKSEWQFTESKKGKFAQRGVVTVSNKLGRLKDGTTFAKRESFAVVLSNEMSSNNLPTAEDILSGKANGVVAVEPLAVTTYCYNKVSEERSKERQQARKNQDTNSAMAKTAISESRS